MEIHALLESHICGYNGERQNICMVNKDVSSVG
jgi:hypothetical protein